MLFVLTDNEETRCPVSLGPIRHRNWPGGMYHSSFIVAELHSGGARVAYTLSDWLWWGWGGF